MSKDYLEYSQERGRSLSDHGKNALRAFEAAYTVGGLIAQIRDQRGITQQELSSLSGVQQADISRIERGRVEATTSTIQRLLDALDARVLVEILPASGVAEQPQPSDVHHVRLSG
jgi:XRE family transcriptional regulator, regulator of sulfur utilization